MKPWLLSYLACQECGGELCQSEVIETRDGDLRTGTLECVECQLMWPVLGGVLTRPQPGDRITDGALVFEVLPAGDDEPCYRFSGPDRQMLRIHTKEA